MTDHSVSTYNIGEIGRMDATEIAGRIRKGDFSADEVLRDVLDRAAFADAELNCLVTKQLNRRVYDRNAQGEVFGGVPTFIKDLTDVKDFPTTLGSRAVSGKPKKKNDTAVDQILSTGTVVIGKSTTSEFGLLPCTETLLTGDTLNPVHTGYSTGGSSGGAAALVAAGVVPFAHAEDGGGSIRIPASCCGLVGLKPTRDRHVNAPTRNMPVHIACHGIVSRTVRDTANYYASIEDHFYNKRLPRIGHVTEPSSKRLRIGMFTETPARIDSHPDVADTILKAGKLCENLGHEVEYIPSPFQQQFKLDFTLYYSFLAMMIQIGGKFTYDPEFRAGMVEPFTRDFGRAFPLVAVQAPISISRLRNFRHEYDQNFESFDVLLSPVLSAPPPKIGHFGPDVDYKLILERMNSYINFTIVQNATGAPAISLPMGKSRHGLPIGAMFAARQGEERKLLELAFEIEDEGGFVS